MKVALILKAPSFDGVVEEKDVIFADGGYKYKSQLGEKNVVAVVGDFDSLGAPPKSEKVITLNEKKDFTDGERSVLLAKEKGFDEVVIYGAFGGKIEHVLGNIALLKIAKNLSLKASIKDGYNIARLLSGVENLVVKENSALSLIPYGGNCKFKRSKGLYYPLDNLTLTPSDTRGISNVAINKSVEIDIEEGESLVFYQIDKG